MDACATARPVPVGSVHRLRLRALLAVVLAAAMTVSAPFVEPAAAAGPAVTLQVTAPTTATAGTAFGVTVTARDAAGLVATSYRGRVTFTATDTRSPVLPAAYTFTAADNGRHTFAGVRLFAAGSRTVAAFDSVKATVKGRSGAIAVAAGAASRLTVTAPATAASGVAVAVAVTVKDDWFNVVSGYRGTVRFTSSDPGSETLPAPYAFTATDRGTHTFAGVVLVSAGSRTVSAADTVTARLTGRSGAIVVAPRLALYAWDGTADSFTYGYPVTPTLVGVETRWAATAAWDHNLAIRTDGTLWAWGSDGGGQLGDGSPGEIRPAPGRVGTRADWAAVAAGEQHTLAIKANGTLWAWGVNSNGLLGDTTRFNRTTPVQVVADKTWKAVTAAAGQTFALTTEGTLWQWGGPWGPPSGFDDDLLPRQVSNRSDWSSVSSVGSHLLALTTDGSLWARGDNQFGQLGIGTLTQPTSEVRVGTEAWSSVEAGDFRSFGIKRDGTLWAWGWNNHGQLGDGTRVNRSAPVEIGGGARWLSVSDSTSFTVAVRADGTLWIWGDDRPMTRVGSSTGWVSATAGRTQVLGLRSTIAGP
jgi:alpha-tubulin suppressor-like RCC1 family protein